MEANYEDEQVGASGLPTRDAHRIFGMGTGQEWGQEWGRSKRAQCLAKVWLQKALMRLLGPRLPNAQPSRPQPQPQHEGCVQVDQPGGLHLVQAGHRTSAPLCSNTQPTSVHTPWAACPSAALTPVIARVSLCMHTLQHCLNSSAGMPFLPKSCRTLWRPCPKHLFLWSYSLCHPQASRLPWIPICTLQAPADEQAPSEPAKQGKEGEE